MLKLKLIRIYFKTVCTFVCKHLRPVPAGIALISAAMLYSCGSGGSSATDETPTRGNIKITVDESFQPLLDTEVSTFMQLYTNATIKPRY
ncbi:MAG: hypothetical protein GX876_02440, partial [Bacteroidales bacterium]|nr:hypothetical protein [Bacteroidales bacterium]